MEARLVYTLSPAMIHLLKPKNSDSYFWYFCADKNLTDQLLSMDD